VDKRTEASRQRAVAMLVLERNRLRERILREETFIASARVYGSLPGDLEAAEAALALYRLELDELTPARRAIVSEDET
jgi:hypothetical protein